MNLNATKVCPSNWIFRGEFQWVVSSLPGMCDPGLPIAAARAGAIGLLDLSLTSDVGRVEWAVERLQRLGRGQRGLVVRPEVGAVENRGTDEDDQA